MTSDEIKTKVDTLVTAVDSGNDAVAKKLGAELFADALTNLASIAQSLKVLASHSRPG